MNFLIAPAEINGNDHGRQATPLRDHPRYSKYFNMLNNKVPPSWVTRVCEVDDVDTRVLDLDPNLPLEDQLPGAVDMLGNIDWSRVNPERSVSSNSVEHSDVDNKVVVDTLASERAEKETMWAKAGEMTDGLRKARSDESLPDVSSKGESTTNPVTTSAADICSAAVATSNSLRAAGGGDKSSDGLGVKRHEDDENDFNGQLSSSPIGNKTRSSRNQGLANELPLAGQQQQHHQQQRSSPSKVDSAATIDSSAWSGSGKNPTPQQLSLYSNMLRLGIPDVAVIRSMERDGMSNSQSILESLKEEHGIPLSSSSATDIMSESTSSVDMPYVRQSSLVSNSSSSNDITSPEEGGDGKDDGKQVATTLRDDPHYSKYFNMLNNKIPLSWVTRVCEVDDVDTRVLDLDPNLPLEDQLPGAVDMLGNIDWSRVNPERSVSSNSVEHSDVDNKVVVDTLASERAEKETMWAKAGEMTDGLRKARSDESLPDVSSKGESTTNPVTTSAADICSAAVATSNSLRAAGGGDKSSDGLGVKRRTIDEIRRQPPQSSPSTNRHTRARPSPKSSNQAGGSTKQSYADLPQKAQQQQQPTNDLCYRSAVSTTSPTAPASASAAKIDQQKSSGREDCDVEFDEFIVFIYSPRASSSSSAAVGATNDREGAAEPRLRDPDGFYSVVRSTKAADDEMDYRPVDNVIIQKDADEMSALPLDEQSLLTGDGESLLSTRPVAPQAAPREPTDTAEEVVNQEGGAGARADEETTNNNQNYCACRQICRIIFTGVACVAGVISAVVGVLEAIDGE